MLTLYSIAGSLNYLVANTSNLSEGMVGYTTKWGDNVGDFSALANFTKEEVCEIGILLGLPSYKELGEYIREGKKGEKFAQISRMHKISQHKRTGVVKYNSDLKNYFDEEEKNV